MLLTKAQSQAFHSHGYAVIDDFLPETFFKSLLANLKFDQDKSVFQIRPSHYSHVFRSDLLTLPTSDEAYIAKFSLLNPSLSKPDLEKLFFDYLVPYMHEATGSAMRYALFPGAVRLRSGDFYRAHQDAYAGIVGYSYFANDGWSWDYGGVLNYVRDSFQAESIFPKANRLLLRNEKFKHFHFLNSIETFCPKEQYIILGWASNIKGDTSQVRGEYLEV